MIPSLLKSSPIEDLARKQGAAMGERAGWRVVRRFGSPADELRAAREDVALADETPNGKLLLEGADAAAVVESAFAIPALAINGGAAFEHGSIYRLRRDLFFISTVPGSERPVAEQADAAARSLLLLPSGPPPASGGSGGGTPGESNAFVTLTDITHGNAEFRVVGPDSAALLSKLCGLDFHPRVFPNQCAKQSSLAKTVQLIIRRDVGALPAYSIIGGRSLGAYLWEAILRAGHEFGIAPLGNDTIRELEQAAQ